jgi:uncharacterized MAPEG superfamily protein
MGDVGSAYSGVIVAWVVLAGAALVQALIADVAGIRSKHVPGMPVTSGHDDLFFRTVRAHANTLENVPVFVVLSLACMLLGASPGATSTLAWVFVAARAVHMVAYYADVRALRSAAFAVSFLASIGLLVVAVRAIG